MKTFEDIARFGAYVSKPYAQDLFRLLNEYKDISSSEAASRLGLHIQTVQDFLDGMTALKVLNKREINEGKRPYYRYSYLNALIEVKFDLNSLSENNKPLEGGMLFIREKNKSGAHFTTARKGKFFSSVSVYIGEGRGAKIKKINLTQAQGQFLFNLPFPDAKPLSVREIMRAADISQEYYSEVLNIAMELIDLNVIESMKEAG